ncbi:hypothetical protein Bca52824_052609 [Brassica carinata]|uniref:RNase H type-1 domain-containing protein n=1 Tax=Brassica carinata TaxID=52824 RepID=A0A8X7R2N7_BRACI|nr:hypothetical protein Bca52824_052609 [Brassica carinata]
MKTGFIIFPTLTWSIYFGGVLIIDPYYKAETWRIAQVVEEVADAVQDQETTLQREERQVPDCKWRCQVDASWKDKNEGASWGFILFEEQQVKLVGVRKGNSLGPELDEIDFLSSEFSSCSIRFIRRTENVRADCLAKAGRSRAPDFCYLDTKIPPWLAHEACLFEPLDT